MTFCFECFDKPSHCTEILHWTFTLKFDVKTLVHCFLHSIFLSVWSKRELVLHVASKFWVLTPMLWSFSLSVVFMEPHSWTIVIRNLIEIHGSCLGIQLCSNPSTTNWPWPGLYKEVRAKTIDFGSAIRFGALGVSIKHKFIYL